ncbi:hypothetical protein F5141DRAFT_1213082 [Pisolithus sp. B1]|nr:hypothetical protein F5141DRAFT_1213082 [Pisolithus sp. B1]
MRRMAEKLGYLAKRRIGLINEAQKALQQLDVVKIIQEPYAVLGSVLYFGFRIEAAAVHLLRLPHTEHWPRAWSTNLSLDMQHLTYFLPSAVLQAPHSPPLPACFDFHCFQDGRRCPDVPKLLPEWTPGSPNKYDGLSTPWWLDGGMDYQSTSNALQSGGLTAVVTYFKNLWVADRSPIATAVDAMQERSITAQVERL